jgi:flagellar basal-body rod modification protein FlgD
MTVSSTSSSGAVASNATQSSGYANLVDGEQLMKLLLAQLRNQNPLDPMQDKDMMGQLAQINSLQELQKINNVLQTMSASAQLADAAGLIGKTVQFANADGEVEQGAVTGVSMVKGQIMLALGERQIPLAAVINVSASVGGSDAGGETEGSDEAGEAVEAAAGAGQAGG